MNDKPTTTRRPPKPGVAPKRSALEELKAIAERASGGAGTPPPQAEGTAVEPETPAPETPAVAATPTGPSFKLMVVYEFVRKDGTRGRTRAFVTGVPDLRTEAHVLGIEGLIRQQFPDYLACEIHDWKRLEG